MIQFTSGRAMKLVAFCLMGKKWSTFLSSNIPIYSSICLSMYLSLSLSLSLSLYIYIYYIYIYIYIYLCISLSLSIYIYIYIYIHIYIYTLFIHTKINPIYDLTFISLFNHVLIYLHCMNLYRFMSFYIPIPFNVWISINISIC